MDNLTEFHYHELLDRTAMLTDICEKYLYNSPVLEVEIELKGKLEKAIELLADSYQDIGNIIHNKFHND
jgi:hypothetical protein